MGHHSGARTASKYARNWAIAAIVTGVAITAVVIIVNVILYVGAAGASTSSNSHDYNHHSI